MAGIQFDTKKLKGGLAALLGGIVLASAIQGAEPPEHVLESTRVRGAAARAMVNLDRRMICWKGETPRFDGQVSQGEYADASPFRWNAEWVEAMKQEITSPGDLDFEGWVKHNGEHLYLALDITDDTFYGIETGRWLPKQDPNAHVIGERERGRPWFGDMIEVLIYGRMLNVLGGRWGRKVALVWSARGASKQEGP